MSDNAAAGAGPSTGAQVAYFAVAGATGYVVNLAVFTAALHVAHLDYRICAVLAFGVALATTFALNRRYTFRAHSAPISAQASRYLVVSLISFGANLAVLNALVELAGVPKLSAQAFAVAVAAPLNFAGQRLWAFRAAHPISATVAIRACLVGLVAVAAALRLYALGHQGFWYDEAVTAWLLRGGPSDVLPTVARTESTPPLYYFVAWEWVRLFGNAEVGLRSLSALAGIATVPAAFLAARELIGRSRVALIAAALVAVNPFLVWYSQEARAYSLLVLLTTLGLWLFARARSRPTPGRLAAWGVCSALALATHYFAIFAIAPQAAWLFFDRRAALQWRVLAMAIVAGTTVPMFALASHQSGKHIRWFANIPLLKRSREIVTQFMVGFDPPATQVVMIVAALAVAVGLGLLLLRGEGLERRGAWLAAGVAAGAVAVPVLAAAAGVDYLNTRNVIAGLVPAAIVVAAGLGARRAGLLGLGAAAVLVVCSLAMIRATAVDPLVQRARWRQLSQALAPAPGSPPKAIIVRGSGTWARSLGYYMPHTWWIHRRGAPVQEIDVLRRPPTATDCPGQSWWGAVCDIGSRPGLHGPPAPGFHRVSTEHVVGFEIVRWRAATPVRYRPLHGHKVRTLLTPMKAPLLP